MRAGIVLSVILWGLILGLTGCSMGTQAGDGLVISGSAAGYRAFLDGMNGMITNTKSKDPLGDSAHWHLRANEESEITKRVQPGLFQKLTSQGEGS